MQFSLGWLSVRTKQAAKGLAHSGLIEEPAKNSPDRAEQQLLNQQGVVSFRKQSTIEKHAGGDLQALFLMPRQQLLGNAVAIVVGQDMDGISNTKMLQERLLQISLFDQAIAVAAGLGGIAKAEHVADHHLIALGQGLPQIVPIP